MSRVLMSFDDADRTASKMSRILGADITCRADGEDDTVYVYIVLAYNSGTVCYAHSSFDEKLVIIDDNFRVKSYVGDPILRTLRWYFDDLDYLERMLSVEMDTLSSVHSCMMNAVAECMSE